MCGRSAARAGVPTKAVRHRVETGALVRLAPTIYRLRDCPLTWRARLWAALLEAGDGAFVSHRSAARLHALWPSW